MGGGNFSLLQLMKELSQPPYNIEPVLLAPLDSPSYSSSIIREAKSQGIKCISLRFYPFKWESRRINNYLRYLLNFINYRIILRKVKKEKPLIIHSNSSVIDIGAFLSSKLKIKHVWHLREFGDLDFNLKPLFGAFQEKVVYRRASKFIAISKSVKIRFLPYIKPESKISVIYNGLPIYRNKMISTKKNSKDIKFCMSGSLNSAKRQIDALRALTELIYVRHIFNVHLFILGDGHDRDKLEEFTRENNLTNYVSFTGWVKDVDKYYDESHIGLMLSTNEGFGRVTIDYMRSGLAVIASDGGGNPELVSHNYTGLIYPTGDITALCDLMEHLVKDNKLRYQISKNAFEFSQTHFKSEDNTKSVYEIYKELI